MFKPTPDTIAEVLREVPKDYQDYGLALMGVPSFWEKTRGSGILVAVLDTGVDTLHPDLKGQIKFSRNFTSPNIANVTDKSGHGTHVAGIIAAEANGHGIVGVAPEASLIVCKVIGDDGSGDFVNIAAAIRWSISLGADVISMSLGCSKKFGELPKFHEAVKEAYNAGIQLVAAAGNEGVNNIAINTVDYPAAYDECWAVGAIDGLKKHAYFSSEGLEVDVCTPGVDVISTFPGGRFCKMSGTSMSTPYFSGVLALIISQFKLRNKRRPTHEEIQELVKAHCEDLGSIGTDADFGKGFFNFSYTKTQG